MHNIITKAVIEPIIGKNERGFANPNKIDVIHNKNPHRSNEAKLKPMHKILFLYYLNYVILVFSSIIYPGIYVR